MRWILFLFLCLKASHAMAQTGWQILPGSPVGQLDACDDQHLLVFGSKIWLSDDGGTTWYAREKPLPENGSLTSAKRITPSDVAVFGNEYGYSQIYYPTLWSSGDRATTFSRSVNELHLSYCFYQLADRTTYNWYYGIHIPVWGRAIYQLVGGNTQIKFESDPYSLPLLTLDSKDSLALAVRGSFNEFELIATTDFGKTWSTEQAYYTEPGVMRWSQGDHWFLTRDSLLEVSLDLGKTWNEVTTFGAWIKDLQFRDSIGLMTLYHQDYLMASTDAGSNWFAQSIDGATEASRIILASDTVSFVQSNRGVLKQNPTRAKPGPVMTMPRVIDLGKLELDQVVEAQVVIKNVGDSALQFSNLEFASPIISAKLDKSELPALSSQSDSVVLTLRYRKGAESNDTVRLTVRSNSTLVGDEIVFRASLEAKGAVDAGERDAILMVLPNPTSGGIRLSIDGLQEVSISDAVGSTVLQTRYDGSEIQLASLAAGIYFLRATDLRTRQRRLVSFVKQW